MHMADALLSPAVGGAMWAVSGCAMAYAARAAHREEELEASSKAPLMGVMGAFVFAAQMINFSIPGTGSSGHIAGALLLAATLGAPAALLTMAVILSIQALFFADGGLLALGANIFNMGFVSCFIAYPLIFRPMLRRGATPGRVIAASLLTSVVGLQLGAFCVALQTLLSGKTMLPFVPFLLLMQPIHLAIGLCEGAITAALLVFLHNAAPEAVRRVWGESARQGAKFPARALALLAVMALLCGGALSWFASSHPDGLEWSIQGVAGEEPQVSGGLHDALGSLQERTAFLPDYSLPAAVEPAPTATSLAGVVGAAITALLVALIGAVMYLPKKKRERRRST